MGGALCWCWNEAETRVKLLLSRGLQSGGEQGCVQGASPLLSGRKAVQTWKARRRDHSSLELPWLVGQGLTTELTLG